jgi:hypothetical protein
MIDFGPLSRWVTCPASEGNPVLTPATEENAMRMNLIGAMLGLAGGAFLAVTSTPAKAADTVVTCKGPFAIVNTGQDGSSPRFTIHCTGGSSAGSITFFAYQISASATVAQLLAQAFETYIARFAATSPGVAVPIASDLSDTSGAAWGCGAANCRIIDYLPQK